MIYLDTSNALQQSIFNGGKWRHSPIFPGFNPPSNTTNLCSSTNILPVIPPAAASAITENDTLNDFLSSVAMYETTNRSLVMVNAEATANFEADPHVNSNLLAEFRGADQGMYVGVGFACEYNVVSPADSTLFYTRVTLGAMRQSELVDILDLVYLYNSNTFYSNEPGSKNASFVEFPSVLSKLAVLQTEAFRTKITQINSVTFRTEPILSSPTSITITLPCHTYIPTIQQSLLPFLSTTPSTYLSPSRATSQILSRPRTHPHTQLSTTRHSHYQAAILQAQRVVGTQPPTASTIKLTHRV